MPSYTGGYTDEMAQLDAMYQQNLGRTMTAEEAAKNSQGLATGNSLSGFESGIKTSAEYTSRGLQPPAGTSAAPTAPPFTPTNTPQMGGGSSAGGTVSGGANYGYNYGESQNTSSGTSSGASSSFGQNTNQSQNSGQSTNASQNTGQSTNQAQNTGQSTNQAQNTGTSASTNSTQMVGGMVDVYGDLLGKNTENYGNVLDAYTQGQSNLSGSLPGVQQGYGDLNSQVAGTLGYGDSPWGIATPAAQAIDDTYQRNVANTTQQMTNAGLGNTTITGNLQGQNASMAGKSYADLGAQLANTYAGYQTQIGLAGRGAEMQGLGMQTGLSQAEGGSLAGYQFSNTAGNLTGGFGQSTSQNQGTSVGQSTNQGTSLGQSTNQGTSTGQSTNQGTSYGQGTNSSTSQNASQNASQGTSLNYGENWGENASQSANTGSNYTQGPVKIEVAPGTAGAPGAAGGSGAAGTGSSSYSLPGSGGSGSSSTTTTGGGQTSGPPSLPGTTPPDAFKPAPKPGDPALPPGVNPALPKPAAPAPLPGNVGGGKPPVVAGPLPPVPGGKVPPGKTTTPPADGGSMWNPGGEEDMTDEELDWDVPPDEPPSSAPAGFMPPIYNNPATGKPAIPPAPWQPAPAGKPTWDGTDGKWKSDAEMEKAYGPNWGKLTTVGGANTAPPPPGGTAQPPVTPPGGPGAGLPPGWSANPVNPAMPEPPPSSPEWDKWLQDGGNKPPGSPKTNATGSPQTNATGGGTTPTVTGGGPLTPAWAGPTAPSSTPLGIPPGAIQTTQGWYDPATGRFIQPSTSYGGNYAR